MIINCLLPGVLEMGVVLVGVVYVPTFHFKKLATMSFSYVLILIIIIFHKKISVKLKKILREGGLNLGGKTDLRGGDPRVPIVCMKP